MARVREASRGDGVAAGASGRCVERPGQLAGEETGGGESRRQGGGAPVLNRGRSREEEEEGWFCNFPKSQGLN